MCLWGGFFVVFSFFKIFFVQHRSIKHTHLLAELHFNRDALANFMQSPFSELFIHNPTFYYSHFPCSIYERNCAENTLEKCKSL